MSDALTSLDKLRFTETISFGSTSPNLRSDFLNQDKIATTLLLSGKFLQEFYHAHSSFSSLSYISILNSQISNFQFKHCARLEDRFKSLCNKTSSLLRTTYRSGQSRKNFLNKYNKVAIFQSELENVKELNMQLAEFRTKCFQLETKCSSLYDELKSAVYHQSELEKKLSLAESESVQLKDYAKNLAERHVTPNDGLNIDDLKSRSHKTAKLRHLKTEAEKALWFAESFGLIPEALKLKSQKGSTYNINFGTSADDHGYDKLNFDEKQKLRELVYILDRFSVSDKAYHELAFFSGDLPKFYLIRQDRDEIDSYCHLERTPGNIPGAFISIKSELENYIRKDFKHQDKISLKFSGDGVKVGRVANFVVLSLSFLNSESNLSTLDQKVISIIHCKENYENLRLACAPVFSELQELNQKGKIKVDENEYDINIFFGGDMKFIQLVLGLNGATSEYACPWCKVSKNVRGDTSKPYDFYHSTDMFRTMGEIKSAAKCAKKLYGVKQDPLIDIEPSKILPDELHLMMRIFDVLLRNLIDDVKDKDDVARVKKENGNYMNSLVDAIRSCGVSFNIWQTKLGNGDIDWTSLTGVDIKKILSKIPERLCFVVHNDTLDATIQIWREFNNLYSFLNSNECEMKSVEYIFKKCKDWVDLFLSLSAKRKGYQPENITPYMHCLIYHVPIFIHKYGTLRKFSGQGVEKTNDTIKKIYHQKTNRSDATVESLKVRKRIEFCHSQKLGREARAYEKRDTDYWENEIFENRARKKTRIECEMNVANEKFGPKHNIDDTEIEKLSTEEIKIKLKELGIATKIRKHDKLVSLLKSKMETSL